jgi:hypothetical protein
MGVFVAPAVVAFVELACMQCLDRGEVCQALGYEVVIMCREHQSWSLCKGGLAAARMQSQSDVGSVTRTLNMSERARERKGL